MRDQLELLDEMVETGVVATVVKVAAMGTALSGSISTVLTVLSWICVGIHSRRALLCPLCA